MVEFSKFAYRNLSVWAEVCMSVTNNPNAKTEDTVEFNRGFSRDAEGDRDKMYIGAYYGYYTDSKLRSVKWNQPTVKSKTIGTFARNTLVQMVTGYQAVWLFIN